MAGSETDGGKRPGLFGRRRTPTHRQQEEQLPPQLRGPLRWGRRLIMLGLVVTGVGIYAAGQGLGKSDADLQLPMLLVLMLGALWMLLAVVRWWLARRYRRAA